MELYSKILGIMVISLVFLGLLGMNAEYNNGYKEGRLNLLEQIKNESSEYQMGRNDLMEQIMTECQHSPQPIEMADTTVLVQYHPLIK